jgi:ribonucleotide monophosphatase NagD (HAD superfamily)
VAAATSVEPTACGKPYEPMRSLVREKVRHGPVWVVGDRPETDLAMGIAEGWETILVMTGVTGDAGDVASEHRPAVVIESVVDLLDVLP